MTYTAYITDRETKESKVFTHDDESKKNFARNLRGNGYIVHFIATPETFEEESAKYHARLEDQRIKAAAKRSTKRMCRGAEEAIAEAEALIAAINANKTETTEDDTHEESTVNQEVETMNETTTTAETVKTTTTSILSIWYGNLEAYNNGALRGQWIDFEEMDRDEIEEVMNKISRNGRDECMIFDYESRCGIDVGEYASVDELFEIYEICENIIDKYGDECGEYAIETFCEFYGAKYLTDIEHYDFYFYSECYSMSDVAFEVVDQCGYLDEMPENLRGYFDYEKFGRDLDIEGHFYYCGNGTYCEMVG